MKYLVYLTTCTANNKIYIGVHKTEDPDKFDGYIGCGVYTTSPITYKKSKTPFQYAVNKYGVKAFKRVVISIFETKEEAYKLESILVDEKFVKREDTYNVQLGGEGGSEKSRKIKIYLYNLDGEYIREFDSALECARYFNKNAKNGSTVSKSAKIGRIVYNHQVSTIKYPFMKKLVPKLGSHSCKKKIARYRDGVFEKEYNSILEAKKDGYINVHKSLSLGRKCKGCTFKYV